MISLVSTTEIICYSSRVKVTQGKLHFNGLFAIPSSSFRGPAALVIKSALLIIVIKE